MSSDQERNSSFPPDIFTQIWDKTYFKDFIKTQYSYSCNTVGFQPKFLNIRIFEIWEAWRYDIVRMPQDSMENEDDAPDHFKQAGVLAYWLRRFSPVYDLIPLPDNQNLPEDKRKRLTKFFLDYHEVVLAFDIGFRLCGFIECNKKDNPLEPKKLSDKYIRQMSHFLKYKNVSPHALSLIYQSIFA